MLKYDKRHSVIYRSFAIIVLGMIMLFGMSTNGVSASVAQSQVTSSINKCRSYVLNNYFDPDYGQEFIVLAQARSGMSTSESFFSVYYNNVANYLAYKEGVLSSGTSRTEYSRTILALTSIGVDATDVAGYNLFDHLSSVSEITKQGMNGAVWALLAIHCHPDYQTSERCALADELVTYLLGKEISGGGWAYSGTIPDGDMTAMTVQALSPYYEREGYEEVTEAIDRAITCLSNAQLSDGGYKSCGYENAETAAQVLTALSAIGIDADTDSRFIKNDYNVVENLLSFQLSDGGFMHVKSNHSANGLATTQAYYALVSYLRSENAQTFLYDMSDLTLTAGLPGDGKTHTGSDKETSAKENTDDSSSDNKKSKTQKASTTEETTAAQSSSNSDTDGTNDRKSSSANSVSTANKAEDSEKNEKEHSEDGWDFAPEEYVSDEGEVVATADSDKMDAVLQSNKSSRTPWVVGAGIVAALVVAYTLSSIMKGKKR